MNSWPILTGKVAEILSVPAYRLTNQISLCKVKPPLILGRRAWGKDHVLAVAKIIGKDTPLIRNVIENI